MSSNQAMGPMTQLLLPYTLPAGATLFNPAMFPDFDGDFLIDNLNPATGYALPDLAQSQFVIDAHRDVVGNVPIYESPRLAKMAGVKQMLIADLSANPGGAYKIRGALNLIATETARATLDDLKNWLITCYSHGNHSNGVGLAAEQIRNRRGAPDGLPVLAAMPCQPQTSIKKIRMSLDRGDTVLLYGNNLTLAENLLADVTRDGFSSLKARGIQVIPYSGNTSDEQIRTLLNQSGPFILRKAPLSENWMQEWDQRFQHKLLVPPYDRLAVSLGQGTGFIDVIKQLPESLVRGGLKVALGVGGAGFLAGMASAMHLMGIPGTITGTNRYEMPVFGRSLFAGELTLDDEELQRPEMDSVMDGIDVPKMGQVPMAQIAKLEKANRGFIRSAFVTETEAREALAFFAQQHKPESGIPIFEGAALAPIAALINGAVAVGKADTVLVTMSGRNVDQRLVDASLQVHGPVVSNADTYGRLINERREVRQRFKGLIPTSLEFWIAKLHREWAAIEVVNRAFYR